MPCKEDNGDMSLIMIDSLTGDEHGKITIPWPGNDDEHNNNMRKIQINVVVIIGFSVFDKIFI